MLLKISQDYFSVYYILVILKIKQNLRGALPSGDLPRMSSDSG